jgi:hypothetical protein
LTSPTAILSQHFMPQGEGMNDSPPKEGPVRSRGTGAEACTDPKIPTDRSRIKITVLRP